MRCLLYCVAGLAACTAAPDWTHDPDAAVTQSGRLAARIVREQHDPARHQATSKVFHHVFAPDGRLLTKGPGGQFGHHRGLFLGWNQLRSNGERYDFWHCNRGESQQFVGRDQRDPQTCVIEWLTPGGVAVLSELRTLRARDFGDAIVLELASELRPLADVVLAGDPQHAGQQFRALQLFAENAGPKVEYLRPATATSHGNDVWRDCGWIAAVLPLPDGEVTVLRVEGPENPKPTSWSTRAYGRFGATFTHRLARGTTLSLSWTYVIAGGRRDLAWCERAFERLQSPAGN